MPVDHGASGARLSVTVQTERVQPDGLGVRLVVVGEIEVTTAELLREFLTRALDLRPRAMVVDLAGVTFMDSTGIVALVQARNRAKADGATLTLTDCQPFVQRLLEVTGLLGPLTGG